MEAQKKKLGRPAMKEKDKKVTCTVSLTVAEQRAIFKITKTKTLTKALLSLLTPKPQDNDTKK